MRDRSRWSAVGAVALAAWGLLGAAAHADRLVTTDGHAVETEGPWRVEGRLVVFERPDGTLASMRRSEVDLEASRRATEEEAAAAVAERDRSTRPPDRQTSHREPIARLTEKELPPVGSGPAAQAETAPEGTDQAADAAADRKPASGLRIASSSEAGYDPSGLVFTGSVRNESSYTAVGVTVTGHLFDENGKESATTAAIVTSSALLAGERADFRATFPGVFSYTRVSFDVDGELLLNEPREQPAASGDQPSGASPSGTPDSRPDRGAGSGAGASGG